MDGYIENAFCAKKRSDKRVIKVGVKKGRGLKLGIKACPLLREKVLGGRKKSMRECRLFCRILFESRLREQIT
jgi:hypothetical protein